MGTYSKYAISHIILRIIQSNKNYYTLETFLYRTMLISLIVKILSEGTFSRVVAHIVKMGETKFLIYVKLVLINDTYCILICCYTPIATTQKRNELTLAPPWTELTLNSTGSAGNDYRKSRDHAHRFIKF